MLTEGRRRAARLTRQHGTTYWWGARILPPAQRRDVFAIYGLARTADDLVDLPDGRGPAEVEASLRRLEADFLGLVEGGVEAGVGAGPLEGADPVVLAAATTTRERGIPLDRFVRFFAAMRQDLTTTSYATWDDLLGYMDGSAAAIGEMMLPVLAPGGVVPASTRRSARSLGLAFQLTNFLRDVAEDLDRGRTYLPREDLEHFGADPERRTPDAAWRALMRFEVERNRRLSREADEGLDDLPLAARRCVATARLLYARILERIETADHDVFAARARVPRRQKLATAARVLASDDPAALVRRDAAVHGTADDWPDDDRVVLLDDQGHGTGVGLKSQVHHDDTPLHLAFSCYVVDPDGRVLVTTRARSKASFPGVVTNSLCGHPRPGEPLEDAVRRRALHELDLELDPERDDLRIVLPRFRYRARSDRLVEHELCPVVIARVDRREPELRPRADEVDAAEWWSWERLRAAAGDPTNPSDRRVPGPGLSSWCREQVALLDELGDDPRAWPAAPRTLLPPALLAADEGERTRA